MGRLLFFWVLLLPGVMCQLPTDLTVTSYDLQLTFTSNLSAPVSGLVNITLTCNQTTNAVVLHWGSSLTADLSTVAVSYQEASSVDAVTVATSASVDPALGWLTISRTDSLKYAALGTIRVTITFQTTINRDYKGLFYRQYQSNNSVIMTNLRPTFARELFPCMDEPQLHANLTLKLTYPSSWVVNATSPASAGPTAGTASGTSTIDFTFNSTPPYNFAFFLATDMSPTTVSVATTNLVFWARKSLSPITVSANAQFFADYFTLVQDVVGTNLPLNQISIVMVPGLEEPFAGYGVIFIREEIYNQDYSSPQMEGLFKSTVAPAVYQFIRQFSEFSSRPTYWSDYWLSQALGKYLQFTILNTALPALDFKTDLEVVARQQALYLDAQLGAKPLRDTSVAVNSTASVQALVNDPLKSLKGAVILNMLDQSLPAGTVRGVVQKFLSDNKGKPVTSAMFGTALEAISSNPLVSSNATLALTKSFSFWTDSSQYPLETVSVLRYSNQTNTGSVNFVTTGTFCSALSPQCTPLPSNVYVPATIGSKSDNRYFSSRQDLWPNNAAADSTISADIDVKDTDWVVANMKSAGYYRNNYTSDNWDRIVYAVSSNDGRLLGRTQLIDDAFALAQSVAPALDYGVAIRLATANLGATQYRNWVPVQRGLRQIANSLMGLEEYSSFKNFAAGYFMSLDAFLQNRSSDPFEKARIQALFLDEMCEYGVAGYRAAALANLTDLLRGTPQNSLPSSSYDAVACCGARYNSTLKAQTLWNILSNPSLNYYSRRFSSVALGCLSNYSDVAQYLDKMAEVDLQLKSYVQITLQNLAEKNPIDFLTNFTQRIDKFQTRLGAVSVASLIMKAGQQINNNQTSVLDGLSSTDAVVAGAIQSVKGMVASKTTWLSTNNQTLLTTLQAHTEPSGSGASTRSVVSLLLFLPLLIVLTPASC